MNEKADTPLRDMEVLYNLSISLMAAETLDGTLDVILQETLGIIKAPAGSIALYDPHTKTMTLHALRGFPEQFAKKTRWHLRPGGITEHILDRQEPTIIHDIVDCPLSINQVLIEAGIKSLIAVPFQAKGKRVGILYIDDYELRQWTPHEVNFLVLLSVQAAVAIEKFKLLEEISEARAYFANVLDNSADIIMTTDPDRRIVEFNKGASRILGYSKEEMAGKFIETLWVNPDERQEILDVMNRFGYVVNHETRLKAKNGKVIDVSLTLSFLDGGNGKKPGTVGVSKDITEKKRLERELEKRNRDLQELNEKLESKVMERTAELSRANRELERSNELKSKFIANMSHELRTPLNSILGFSELLRDDTVQPLTKKQKRFATNIHNSGSHLLQLINNILDIAKIESGKITLSYESFSIQQVISEVESIVRSLSDKKAQKLRTWITEEVTMIRADRVKFKQILYNLLSNAIKFSPNKSDIHIEVERLNNAGLECSFSTDSNSAVGDFIRVSVTDKGIGIKEEDQEKIFEEFEQVDSSFSRRYEGTGLGLSLTRRLVELHGGEIRVKSKLGEGSTFTVDMPLMEPVTIPDNQHRTATPDKLPADFPVFKARKEGGPLILVAEDDLPTSELMTLYLVEGGYQVAHVYNGDDAIDRIRELMPFAVILDIMLPGKDGWEIIQEIKSSPELKKIPVIMSSVIDNNELGFALGASDYMVKPVDRCSLLAKLNDLSLSTRKDCKTVNILCIDPDTKALEILREILEPSGYMVITSTSGKDGIEKAVLYNPDLIILDLMLPDVDGFDVTLALKDNPVTMDIPIFVITEKNITPQERLRLAGKIVSYMQKRYFTKEDLLMHMRNLELTYPVQAGLLDEVSGLLDYSYFQIRLAQEVSRAKRYKNTFTVILVDLDHFTEYIRANGSHQSDICIRKIAEFLKKSTRGSDTVVRYGADEFAVILSNTVQEMAIVVARRLHAYIEDYPFYGEELTPKGKITASVAVVNHPRDGEVPEEILATAHDLMRTIKEKGGGRIEFYEHKSRSKNTDRRG